MMNKEMIERINSLAHAIRVDIIKTGYLAGKKGAHFGGSLSLAEILATLYHSFIRFDKADLEHRDRVILSKGHAALALYCTLYEKGVISKEDLGSFENNGSDFVAHSKRIVEKGLDFAGGSLSLGMSFSTGVALACKKKGYNSHIYTILGDGELDEGLVWESLLFANQHKLNNLTIIVDHNHLQADGAIEDVIDTAPLAEKFYSFGFEAKQVDGHNVEELYDAISSTRETSKPVAIIAETVKGKGISFIENKAKWHHGSLSESRYKKALKELGTNAE